MIGPIPRCPRAVTLTCPRLAGTGTTSSTRISPPTLASLFISTNPPYPPGATTLLPARSGRQAQFKSPRSSKYLDLRCHRKARKPIKNTSPGLYRPLRIPRLLLSLCLLLGRPLVILTKPQRPHVAAVRRHSSFSIVYLIGPRADFYRYCIRYHIIPTLHTALCLGPLTSVRYRTSSSLFPS